MKSSILKVLGSVIVASTCLMAYPKTSSAQTNADLELVVSSPENNQVIPFGDTVQTIFFIINHGPDPIINDTLIISNNLNPVSSGFVGSIAVGDTGVCHGIIQWADAGDTNNATISLCYYFPAEVSLSNNVVDNNAANDTACVSYVMLGDTSETGISDFSAPTSLKLYPNPATDVVKILININQPNIVELSVKNILGRTVLQHNYGWLSQSKPLKLDVSSLKEGIYFVKMAVGQQIVTRKLVIL